MKSLIFIKQLWPPILLFILISVVFEILSRNSVIPAYILPAPTQVLSCFIDEFDPLTKAFASSLFCSSIGFLLSLSIGSLSASIIFLVPGLKRSIYPYLILLQTVPIVAIAPILVIWFGYGQPTVIASSFLVSVFPISVAALQGFDNPNPLLLDLFYVYKSSKLRIFFKLLWPSSLPLLISAAKVSAGLAVIGAIVGEFIAGTGLGSLIDSARTQQRIDLVFAGILLGSLLGVIFVAIMSVLMPALSVKLPWLKERWD